LGGAHPEVEYACHSHSGDCRSGCNARCARPILWGAVCLFTSPYFGKQPGTQFVHRYLVGRFVKASSSALLIKLLALGAQRSKYRLAMGNQPSAIDPAPEWR